jgi:hypothetical protein
VEEAWFPPVGTKGIPQWRGSVERPGYFPDWGTLVKFVAGLAVRPVIISKNPIPVLGNLPRFDEWVTEATTPKIVYRNAKNELEEAFKASRASGVDVMKLENQEIEILLNQSYILRYNEHGLALFAKDGGPAILNEQDLQVLVCFVLGCEKTKEDIPFLYAPFCREILYEWLGPEAVVERQLVQKDSATLQDDTVPNSSLSITEEKPSTFGNDVTPTITQRPSAPSAVESWLKEEVHVEHVILPGQWDAEFEQGIDQIINEL